MKLKLAIFDVEGTLVDSKSGMVRSIVHAAECIGLTAPRNDKIEAVIGQPLNKIISTLFPSISDVNDEKVNQMYKIILDQTTKRQSDNTLFPGALEMLHKVRSSGIKLVLSTNKIKKHLDSLLEKLSLTDFFDGLYTADEYQAKPSPVMIMAAMKNTGAGLMETAMIGDTIYDMVAADKAGCYGIGVSWGYQSVDDLLQAKATKVVSSFDELGSELVSWQKAA